MKNIFKKNQIIITALALMLVIAGCLNFMSRGKEDAQKEVGVNGAQDYDTYIETADDDLDDSDLLSIDNMNMLNADGSLIESEDMTDISDEDILTVTDGGEVVGTEMAQTVETPAEDVETSAPGEAIIVSTTIGKNYFASAKLEREQLRAVSNERLLGIVNNEQLTEEAKSDAIAGLIELTKIAENENDIEALLEAKGYMDSVVTISDNSVDVIVNAETITEQDMAIIEDVVLRKTDAKAAEIFITPVVLGE